MLKHIPQLFNESRPCASVPSQSRGPSDQYGCTFVLVVMDHIETFHNKRAVAAETVGCTFEADLFKTVPMLLRCCCHGQHWDFSQSEDGCCRNGSLQIRSRPLQIRTDHHTLWRQWTTLRRFTNIQWLHWKTLVSDSKQTSSNQYRWS